MQPKAEGAVPPVEKKPNPRPNREVLTRVIQQSRNSSNQDRIYGSLDTASRRRAEGEGGSDIYQELLKKQFGASNPALLDGGSKKLSRELIKTLDSMGEDYTSPDFATDRVVAEFARQKGLTPESSALEQAKRETTEKVNRAFDRATQKTMEAVTHIDPLTNLTIDDSEVHDVPAATPGLKDRVQQAATDAYNAAGQRVMERVTRIKPLTDLTTDSEDSTTEEDTDDEPTAAEKKAGIKERVNQAFTTAENQLTSAKERLAKGMNDADDRLTQGFDAAGQRIMETVTPIKPLTNLTTEPTTETASSDTDLSEAKDEEISEPEDNSAENLPQTQEDNENMVNQILRDAQKSDLSNDDEIDAYFTSLKRSGVSSANIDAAMLQLLQQKDDENIATTTDTAAPDTTDSAEPTEAADRKIVRTAEFAPFGDIPDPYENVDASNPNMINRMIAEAQKTPYREREEHFARLERSGVSPEIIDSVWRLAYDENLEADDTANLIAKTVAERALARPPWLRSNFLDSLIQREGLSPRFIEQAREQMRLMEEKRKTDQIKAVNPIQAPIVENGSRRNLRKTIRDGIDRVQPMVNAADDGLSRGFDATGQRILETITPIKPLTHLTQRPDVISGATHEAPLASQNMAQAEQPLTAFDAERIFSLLRSIQELPEDQQEAALAEREGLMLDPRIAQEVRTRLAEEKKEKQQAEAEAALNQPASREAVSPEPLPEETPSTEQVAPEAPLTGAEKQVANDYLEEALRTTRSNDEAQALFQDIERKYKRWGFSLVPVNEARRLYNEARTANPTAFPPEPAPPAPRRNFLSNFASRFRRFGRPQRSAGNTFLNETLPEVQPEPEAQPQQAETPSQFNETRINQIIEDTKSMSPNQIDDALQQLIGINDIDYATAQEIRRRLTQPIAA